MRCRTVLVLLLCAPFARAEEKESPLAELERRNIGPSIMGGRVSDVEGVPGDPRIVYVGAGAASGGDTGSRMHPMIYSSWGPRDSRRYFSIRTRIAS